MELTDLTNKFTELLEVENISEAPHKIMEVLFSQSDLFFDKWLEHFPDLSSDHLQPIFQYYMADRKVKMQDYTPKTLASLCAKLASIETAKSCYDMCAGSGALTIQAWSLNSKCKFVCEEFDERVIPFLICNLAMRNMSATVIHGDVISGEKFKAWELNPSEKYSKIKEIAAPENIKTDICISNPPYNIKWTPEPFIQLDDRYYLYGTPPTSNANYVFVLTALNIAKRACLILPCGVLSTKVSSEKDIIKNIIVSNKLDAVISNPDNMFEATSIGTCLYCIDNKKSDSMTAFVDMRKTYIEETREQRGQYGGASHTNRVYKKSIKTFSSEQIQKALSAVKNRSSEPEFCKPASIEDLKSNDFNLVPSAYIEFIDKPILHRPYKDIIKDINQTRQEKNCCKLVINETLAKRLGFDLGLYCSEDNNDKGFDELMQRLSGEKLIKSDYIQFTKNKNELTFKNNDAEIISSILTSIMQMWKQHIMYLNGVENRYLAEMRDALLPDLMSGKIEI